MSLTARIVLRLGGRIALVLASTLAPPSLPAQSPPTSGALQDCPRDADWATNQGWTAYRAGSHEAARARFAEALDACPRHVGALSGAGYVALQQERLQESAARFDQVLDLSPDDVDALIGLGLIAWREADLAMVEQRFSRVGELDPGNATATDYLARLPAGLGSPPVRAPLDLPDTIRLAARTRGDRFQVVGGGSWRDFWVKGINLGAALPGRNPSDFPDRETYDGWIQQMARMNVNTIRVYTIHPPAFYDALAEYNRTHPDDPLWLIHGVWTELPPDDDFLGQGFEGEFFAEMRRVVDLLHGRADIRPRPGHASGFYTSDVSPWTLAYIIGREWEPHSTIAFDSIRPELDRYEGRYVRVEEGNAMDAWLGRAVDTLIAYETERYRTQRPVAWTNWPTLDPLDHPTESTREEEVALRRARGERIDLEPREYDNDGISVDPSLLRPTEAFGAGTFASYHAYPYYPDFLILSERYRGARSSIGASNYFGYLRELKAHHDGMPLLIAEYGVPASLGPAHLQPQGWHHGGLSEAEMAEVNRRLTLEIAEAGAAGAILFAWIDEWFKSNWLTIDFELPYERNRLWYNRLDAEQHYGVLATEAEPAVAGERLSDRLESWAGVPPLRGMEGLTVRAAADAAYLWLLVETPERTPGDRVMVGLDTVEPELGEFRWPGGEGGRLPVGIEFALVDDGSEVRILAHPPQNPFRLVPVGEGGEGPVAEAVEIADPPSGLFRARHEQRLNVPLVSLPLEDGIFDSLRVIPNRRRIGRDGREHLAIGYERGLLPEGPAPDGLVSRGPGVTEVRIPWLLVNVTDPSSRSVLWSPGGDPAGLERTAEGRIPDPIGGPGPSDTLSNALGVRETEGIRVLASMRHADGRWTDGWRGEGPSGVGMFTWPVWEEPSWRVRERPSFSVMAETFDSLDPWSASAAVGGAGDGAAGAVEPGADPEPLGAEAAPTIGSVELRADPDSLDAEAARAWMEGRTSDAEALYRILLEDRPDHIPALHRVALASAWDGRTGEALTMLERLLVVAPDHVDANVDRARFTAWEGRLEESLAVLDSLAGEHPNHPAVLEERARVRAWAGRYHESIEDYDELLTVAPENQVARRARAQALSWAEDFERATAAYEGMLAESPGDVETRLGLARVLAFADRLEEAGSEYDRILAADPDDVRALQGKGRVLAWGGELVDAETTLVRARRLAPDDVDVRVLLAQVLRWQGRNAAALEEIRAAERVEPGRDDVAEQREWIDVALDPAARSNLALEGDSDENRMLTLSLGASATAMSRLSVRGDVYQRTLEQGGLEPRQARGGQLTASLQLEPGWTISAGAGVSGSDDPGSQNISTATASLVSPRRYSVSGAVTWTRQALDVTAALARSGVRTDGVDLGLQWAPNPQWSVGGGGGWTVFKGSEANERRHWSASLQRRVGTGWTFGLAGRSFSFQKDLADGYFDPDRFRLLEATARWAYEPGPWRLVLEAAPGLQQVRDLDPSATVRAATRLTFRLRPGRDIYAGATGSSAGLQSFASEEGYRYFALVAGVSWVF